MESRFNKIKHTIELNDDKYTQSLITSKSGLLHFPASPNSEQGLELNYCMRVPNFNNIDEFAKKYKFMDPHVISDDVKAKVESAMTKWSQVANIRFQQDDPCQIYIFSINDNDEPGVFAITSKLTYCFIENIKINPNDCFSQNNYPSMLIFNRNHHLFNSITHEHLNILRQLGTIIGLQPPYESNYSDELSKINDFTLLNSIMNKKQAVTFIDKKIHIFTPINPSFYDIKALRILLGNHTRTKKVDRFYNLSELSNTAYQLATPPSGYEFIRSKTVETLVDEGGINTLVANSINENIGINLNEGPNYISMVGNKHYIVLYGHFHNVIDHSQRDNQVILNHENNIIDFGLNNEGNKTIITDTLSGNDWILGFNVKFHQIFIQSKDPYIPYRLEQISYLSTHFLNTTISYDGGTNIVINNDHSIFLPNVYPNQLKNSILIQQVKPDELLGRKEFLPHHHQQHITSLTDLPPIFIESIIAGAGYTFILSTSEYVLKRYHYSNDTIHLSLTTLKIGFSIYNQSVIPLATEFLCRRIGFTEETSRLIGISTNVAAKAITMPTPLGAIEFVLRFSGSYIGSLLTNKLTLFAKTYIPSLIEYMKDEDHHYNLR